MVEYPTPAHPGQELAEATPKPPQAAAAHGSLQPPRRKRPQPAIAELASTTKRPTKHRKILDFMKFSALLSEI